MRKLLVVCGPTATGKTSLAIELAKKFNSEIVSADSRQVYKGMDIGTGKDIPKGANFKYKNKKLRGYYLIDGVKVWGYDLVNADADFNVSDYITIAREVIDYIWEKNCLPIVVGGTGFYIKSLIDGIKTAGIKKNVELRKKLAEKTAEELFKILKKLDPKKATSLNQSDRKNKRRLIRAIEVSKDSGKRNAIKKLNCENLFIGLKAPPGLIEKNIRERVKERFGKGMTKEVNKLLRNGVTWDNKSMTGTGYRQMGAYLNGGESIKETIDKWAIAEVQYAKRQMTWFKKDKRITWFDIGESKYEQMIEKYVTRWYFNN